MTDPLTPAPAPDRKSRTVRLPGFVRDEPVGLGDAIKRATTAIGLKPCSGCQERAARLNQRVQFGGRKR
jgi:hypothetical protein